MYRFHYLLLMLNVLAVAACSPEEAEMNPEDLIRSVNVYLEELEMQDFSSYLRLVGTVVTSQDVRISAEVNGRVIEFFRREGSSVSRGEPILKIDDQRLVQEVRRLRAVTEQSRENHERLQRLYVNENIGSEMDLLNAQYTYEQNQAALAGLQIDLENTTIRAPFSGQVDQVLVEVGEMVSPGTPVLRMISRDGMKVTLGVPARYADVVDEGDEAEAWFDFDTERRYTLPITFVGGSIDPRNRTFKVDLELPRDLENLKVDMLVNVRLRTNHLEDVIVIGEENVFRKNGRFVAYVSGQNERGQSVALERALRLGPSFGNQVVVTEGLQPGERLVTTGSSYLQDQTRITILEREQQATVQRAASTVNGGQ